MIQNNDTYGRGACSSPFLEEDLFPHSGGFIEGRFCTEAFGKSCCLPCPQTEWLYSNNFDTIMAAMDWVNVVGMVCTVYLLISFAVLPVQKTHRHYLSVCLAISIGIMQLGFIIPLGARPQQCFNAITPNDMHSNRTCAISGAFLLFGGCSAVMWTFLRSVALHMQICRQITLGNSFMWGSLGAGWAIPTIVLTLALVFSGVSFRFGDTCHINHKNGLADFWAPLLFFTGTTLFVQFATFCYCTKVYLASLTENLAACNSSGRQSYSNSVRGTISSGLAYRRVRRVVQLQWRGIMIVLLVVAEVILFSVVSMFMDDVQTKLLRDPTKAGDWILCMIDNERDGNECTHLAQKLVVNEATIIAVLLLLSLNGIWSFVFFGRLSMFTGWCEKARGWGKPANINFVNADAHGFEDSGTYEILERQCDVYKTPEPVFTKISSPLATAKGGRVTPEYFGRDTQYKSPPQSFSSPRPPNTTCTTSHD